MKLHIVVVALALTTAGIAAAAPTGVADHTPPGQIICKEHTPNCGKKVRTIEKDIHVNEDDERVFKDGTFRILGTIYVHANGHLIVSNASVIFGPDSMGIIVEPQGVMDLLDSVLQPDPDTGSAYGIDVTGAESGVIAGTWVLHGSGVTIAASTLTFDANRLEGMTTALSLTDTSIVVSNSHFLGNDLGVYQEGGSPTLVGNTLEGGTTCVHNFRTNPTIKENTFRGCHTGIRHEESHSSITRNSFFDDGVPPGAGVAVFGSSSVVGFGVMSLSEPEPVLIEGNRIENHATGIAVYGGRALIRANVVVGNPGVGIYVESNPASMDITGNTVQSNTGHGIQLVDVADVAVTGNVVSANGGDGILLQGAADVTLDSNAVADAAASGIVVDAASSGVALTNNTVAGAAGAGISVSAAGTALSFNLVEGAATGFVVAAESVSLLGDVARGNAGAGFLLQDAAALLAADLYATGNGVGVSLSGASTASLARVNASGNLGHGFLVDYAGDVTLLEIVRPTAIANEGDGVLNVGGPIAMESGWFEANVGFGVRTGDVEAVVTAPLAWWGDALGPGNIVPLSNGDEASENVVWFPPALAPPVD